MSSSPSSSSSWQELENRSDFISRHVGPSVDETKAMLGVLGLKTVDDLVKQTIPSGILLGKDLDLGAPVPETEMLARARAFASQNKVLKSFIGTGYYGTFTPNVILRNVLENPGWYTAYTPYQAEIAQGRLEALLNFQTVICDLTGLPVSNASLLDEGTAAAEAMHLCQSITKLKNATRILVADDSHPQTIEVIRRRAEPLEIEVAVMPVEKFSFDDKTFAAFVQYPSTTGLITDYSALASKAHAAGTLVIASADLLALTMLKAPGEWGADVVVGTSQRFGVPMGFGGPHAGYMATKDEFKRSIPGRLVGVSVDAQNKPAMRLALQTREQHIRREKATSNICTAQVLLAVMASMYAVYHGPKGLKRIAERTHRLAAAFAEGLKAAGLKPLHTAFFDTVTVETPEAGAIVARALAAGMNLRHFSKAAGDTVSVSFDETSTREDVARLLKAFAPQASAFNIDTCTATAIPSGLVRTTSYLTHPTFNSYHSETEMLRYMTRLQTKDLSLAHSMIPLGSCTMKLNATAEMIPVTWPEFGSLHPFIPMDQAKGSLALIHELEGALSEVTGFAGVSVQPNSGASGEYAGLLAIRDYHRSKGDTHRTVCLIPASAHGTNPASAAMAGMKVVVVKSDNDGNVDVADLRARAQEHAANLAALMITYPSTHGVFEESIREICEIVHAGGGQVYMDGANFTAMVGLARPGDFGPDVCHLNLHKTFCIPHGGGGPGVGPICVREHLKPFLPGTSTVQGTGLRGGVSAVASAPFGSASILPISWAYITMMGRDGLKRATETAILNANYIAARLAPHYPVLYRGKNGRVAHECIVDLRPLKAASGVEVEDVAKRLIDYGFHAPTMSWPVPGTLMIEPTESESKAELDRFCDAMIAIRQEIREIEAGTLDKENNPLKHAPHTISAVTTETWDHPYSRERAAFPLPWVKERKFWPAVARVNNPYGDKNFVCSCPPIESYQ
jgi:glycine dehydrogenase